MKNIAVIFAGGTGQRMNSKTKPKQFLELHGKPILIYTLEQFQNHLLIDGIIIVMLENWIDYTKKLLKKYEISKVIDVVEGGCSGQESIYNGLCAAEDNYSNCNVLIHDGVRPLIDGETISRAIDCLQKYGSAITVSPAIETIAIKGWSGGIDDIVDRSRCYYAKAPQCFRLEDILSAHRKALNENKRGFIDSASLMKHYGGKLHPIEGNAENIKITTPSDFYIFRAIMDARENSQIMGL